MPDASVKSVIRIVVIVVAAAICLYLVYLVRKPLSWLLISVFLAVALSAPVNALAAHMRRGAAIALVYLGLLIVPLGLMALIVPPLITEANNFAENVPSYARDVSRYVEDNERLRSLNEDYDITSKLQDEAEKLPTKLGGAAKTLRDVGFGIVNSAFALITILVLTAFLLSNGRRWTDAALGLRPPEQAGRLRRSLDSMAQAVGGYVAGALFIAVIAGIATYVVLTILGVPFRAPLAVIAGLFSLIPLVGATIAAVLIGVVTVFEDFPTDTIIWVIWAIVYQQFENHVIQPQVQKRTVHVHPFLTIVAVLFGATLLGIFGALVAIPIAASIQILLREYWDWRTLSVKLRSGGPDGPSAAGDDAPPGSEPPPEAPPPPAAAGGPVPA
ncbi:MAG TPA: AI-2E family transporter [Thermoleophilaceae bacterium]